jgi:hypothetical protein
MCFLINVPTFWQKDFQQTNDLLKFETIVNVEKNQLSWNAVKCQFLLISTILLSSFFFAKVTLNR